MHVKCDECGITFPKIRSRAKKDKHNFCCRLHRDSYIAKHGFYGNKTDHHTFKKLLSLADEYQKRHPAGSNPWRVYQKL
jgi:hypothetical protein